MKKIIYLMTLILALFSFSACDTLNPDNGGSALASDYFPIMENVRYYYQGDQNDYGTFDVYPDYASDQAMQLRVNANDTCEMAVIKTADNQVTLVYQDRNVSYRENLLEKTNTDLVLLKTPIAADSSWQFGESATRSITNVATTVDTPIASYEAIEVTTDYGDYQTIEYYAKDVGLVKKTTITANSSVTSILTSVVLDAAIIQSVNFYYPNLDHEIIYYQTKELQFKTNDSTAAIIQDGYKYVPENVNPVLSANTTVNDYYLNDENQAYLDLSSQFISEMNSGAQLESMILTALANTFGSYYGANEVMLRIDGNLYESGHIALLEDETIAVDAINSFDIATFDDHIPDATPTSVASDYFPIIDNSHYVYQGAGNEYASYDVYIDYSDQNTLQQRINNGGTELIRVIKITTDAITKTYQQGEAYARANMMKKTNADEILLKGPITVGTSWSIGGGATREITNGAVALTTPSGTYTAIEVTTTNGTDVTKDYYVKDIGLVKSVSTGTDYEVSSTLGKIETDKAFVQAVKFYYPNVNDDKLYYQTKSISFKTNDITRIVFQNAYKEVPANVAKVFSNNTKINWYYLNQDGMTYIDLNRAFITEMNAGSGYEGMILQCVANTFGGYFSTAKVVLTIDGGLYESGHFAFGRFEYLDVDFSNSFDIATLSPTTTSGSASSYFPILQNTQYTYQGEGNEYAYFNTHIDYTNENSYQERVNNGGTEVVRVIKVEKDKVTLTYSQAETYYRENSLKKTNTSEVLLQGPVKVGTSWQLANGNTRKITAIDKQITTPKGTYKTVEVTTQGPNYQNVYYYAQNVGLIKILSKGEGYEISSNLEKIETDKALVQHIAFYYPNINDDKIYYQFKSISFKTNDITRLVLQNAYKQVPGSVGKVFSNNTKINWLYLNQDGMAYIDLSQEYLSEMSAGAGYEAMMLQCIANTFGSYYGVNRVLLTIDNKQYSSGHIYLEKFEYLTVDTSNNVALN